MLIDSHCHLLSTEYEDVDEEIKKALSNGVEKIIINGYDISSSMEAVDLAKKYNEVYAAVGIGPEEVGNVTDEEINEILNLSEKTKVVAIGEIGLDYYWTKDNKEKQIYVLKKMFEIANLRKLPVIIHSRESVADIYNFVKEYNVSGIMHCYSGSKEMAKAFIKLGFLIGIGGVVTFKNAKKLKDVVENIDLTNISLETDSPYLTPEPYRGKKNNPKNLVYIAEEIAKIKGITKEKVITQSGLNILTKFDL